MPLLAFVASASRCAAVAIQSTSPSPFSSFSPGAFRYSWVSAASRPRTAAGSNPASCPPRIPNSSLRRSGSYFLL